MKVYVSADMEGIGGVCHPTDVSDADRSNPDYARARVLMTEEVNAAVAGAFEAGADEVLVNDSHGSMRNLLQDLLDPRVRLVRGAVKPSVMMSGLDDSFDAAVLIGYHAKAGDAGVLSHTLNGRELLELQVNGVPIGEIGVSALLAGALGVPVAFLSGDTDACVEARSLLGPTLTTFATKTAIDRLSTNGLSPQECRVGIRRGVQVALGSSTEVHRPSGPHTLRCEWRTTTAAHVCSWVPGVERVSGRGTEFTLDSIAAAVDLLIVLLITASAVEGI